MSTSRATSLLDRTSELMAIRSESFDESDLVEHLESLLRAAPHLEVTRVGDNLVARTQLGRPVRVLFAGHSDTVPANDNEVPRRVGDRLYGLGAADMKGGLAVMLEAVLGVTDPAVDVSFVVYAREEVAAVHSGLEELFVERPDLLAADVAILGEPTDGQIEAGCQGTLRLRVELRGERAHTARAWKGRNAIHRLGPLLTAISNAEVRRPLIDGCQFHEALQVVRIEGGIAGNVVPDRAEIHLGHRFAPDRDADTAGDWVRSVIAPHLDEDDVVEVIDVSPAAPPAVTHPCVAALIERHGLAVRAKLGWTDVARFTQHGVAAVNLGPGDSSLAHTAGEYVESSSLVRASTALEDLLRNGP